MNVPVPLIQVTPLALNRKATPLVIRLTVRAFHSFAAGKSNSGMPSLTPSLPEVCPACFSAKAVCAHAFVGMQPMRRQVPPSSGSRSMHATLRAELCGTDRGGVAPGPPPRTATSTFIACLQQGWPPTPAVAVRRVW